MPLLQLFRLLLACVLTLANFSVQARLAQNTPLEKMAFSSVDCAQVWSAQALDSYQENGFPDAALVSGPTLYNYFRTYDPKTGRYSQNDPIGLNAGLNRFGYAYQNGLIFTDPLGLEPKYEKPPNPNKKPPPEHRVPSGERERNVGHQNAEEHSKTAKGQRGTRGSRGARGVGGILIWDLVNGVCEENPGLPECQVFTPPSPPCPD